MDSIKNNIIITNNILKCHEIKKKLMSKYVEYVFFKYGDNLTNANILEYACDELLKKYRMVNFTYDELNRLLVMFEEVIRETKIKVMCINLYEKEVKWFKLFEFKVSIPFLAPGFLAKISKTIADKKLNILIVSTFSKDYALIREEDFKVAVKALEKVGFSVKLEE